MAIDVQQLQKHKVYEASAPLMSIYEDLDQIGKFVEADKARRHSKKVYAGVTILAGVLLFIAAAVTSKGALSVLGFLAIAAGIVLFIMSIIGKSALIKHPGRLGLIRELLGMVEHDSRPDKPVSLRFALEEQPQVIKEQPLHGRKNGKEKLAKDDWVSLESEMLDGTVVSEKIVELRRTRSFTNARGKSKSKVRNQYLLTLRFRYPGDVYGDLRASQEALAKEIRFTPSATLRGVRVSEKAVLVKGLLTDENDVAKNTAMACLGVYRIMNLSRRVAAGMTSGGPAEAR